MLSKGNESYLKITNSKKVRIANFVHKLQGLVAMFLQVEPGPVTDPVPGVNDLRDFLNLRMLLKNR